MLFMGGQGKIIKLQFGEVKFVMPKGYPSGEIKQRVGCRSGELRRETGDTSLDVISPLMVYQALEMHEHNQSECRERRRSWTKEVQSLEVGFRRRCVESHLERGSPPDEGRGSLGRDGGD